jgi:glycosyltransferase involved in cell wall biosynthesis
MASPSDQPGQPRKPISRIALILQSVAVGGMETHCVDLAAEYVRRGIKVLAVLPEAPLFDDLASRFRAGGAAVARLDTDARAGRLAQLRRWPRLIQTLRSFDPDVLHEHTGGATGGFSMIALGRCLTRATVAITEHDVPVLRPPWQQRLARHGIDFCSHAVVAVSRRNARLRAERLGAPDGHAVVLNGVPLPAATAEERAENRRRIREQAGIAPSAVVVGSVVRLSSDKGLDTLLAAVELAVPQAPFELLLVGDGPLRAALERQRQGLRAAEHIHFGGHQPQPFQFMDAMDVFVLPVPAGSMSIALLEAMARGLPPVITFGGPEEAVIPEETGLTAAPSDPPALAAALARLVSDGALRERLSAAAAAHVAQHFSVGRVVDDLLDVYAGAAGRHVPDRLRATAAPNPRPGSGA